MPNIGPNFANELLFAGAAGCTFSPDGEINFPPGTTEEQVAGVMAVLAAHHPETINAIEAVRVALAEGVVLRSGTASTLNATYACDPPTQQSITAEAVYIQSTGGISAGKFTNGQTTKAWPDITGVTHTFSLSQFIAFAEAVATYIDQLATARAVALSGPPWTWSAPSAEVSIP